MKILVAAAGPMNPGEEFHWTTEGELVSPGFVCDSDAKGRGFGCGCSRSFSGFDSHKAGTTAMVVDRDDITEQSLAEKWLESMRAAGWDLRPAVAARAAQEILAIAEQFPEGALIVRDFDDFSIKGS